MSKVIFAIPVHLNLMQHHRQIKATLEILVKDGSKNYLWRYAILSCKPQNWAATKKNKMISY
jgi:hypothetical protein